uniref:Uncharacterized protein n=1 Tax=Anguilla anguilla TaxID=7936 RepID=A0A0E9WG27_ANGAN
MLARKKSLIHSFRESLKTKARTAARSSRKRMKQMRPEKNLSRQMFSRSAPTQPANPRMKETPPTIRTNHTGSKPCDRVTWVRSDSIPFSLQAQNPMAINPAPANQNKML